MYGQMLQVTNDAWTGAMTDILYIVWMDGDFTMILCR